MRGGPGGRRLKSHPARDGTLSLIFGSVRPDDRLIVSDLRETGNYFLDII